MNNIKDPVYNWTKDDIIEISLKNAKEFLCVKETLSRIGIPSKKTEKNVLNQTCHLIQDGDRYWILHFKELYAISDCNFIITESDMKRRNYIVSLLDKWGLISVVNPENLIEDQYTTQSIPLVTVIKNDEVSEWTLSKKFTMSLNLDIMRKFIKNFCEI